PASGSCRKCGTSTTTARHARSTCTSPRCGRSWATIRPTRASSRPYAGSDSASKPVDVRRLLLASTLTIVVAILVLFGVPLGIVVDRAVHSDAQSRLESEATRVARELGRA